MADVSKTDLRKALDDVNRLQKDLSQALGETAVPETKSIFRKAFNVVRGTVGHVKDTVVDAANRIDAEVECKDKLRAEERNLENEVRKQTREAMKNIREGKAPTC